MNTSVTLMVVAIIIVGLILLAIILFVKHPGTKQLDQIRYRERWMSIMGEIQDTQSSMQIAIMNADKLLDTALKERGVPGDSLGERLKNGKDLFSDRNGLWQAHKLRNHIAHDENVRLTMRRTQQAMAKFKAALKDVGAL